MTARANIYIDQGADFNVSIELYDDQDNPLDTTNCNFYSSVSKLYSTTPIASFITGKHVGSVDLGMYANTSAHLEPGKYNYDVLMVDGSGAKYKIIEGLAFVTSTITRI